MVKTAKDSYEEMAVKLTDLQAKLEKYGEQRDQTRTKAAADALAYMKIVRTETTEAVKEFNDAAAHLQAEQVEMRIRHTCEEHSFVQPLDALLACDTGVPVSQAERAHSFPAAAWHTLRFSVDSQTTCPCWLSWVWTSH